MAVQYDNQRAGSVSDRRTRSTSDAVRKFAQKEIVPIAAEFDESGEFPLDTIKKMGAMGLMGIEVPEEYGGAGMDTWPMC